MFLFIYLQTNYRYGASNDSNYSITINQRTSAGLEITCHAGRFCGSQDFQMSSTVGHFSSLAAWIATLRYC